MTINNCDSQSAQHLQEIYLPQWHILRVMMHVMHNIALAATDVAPRIVTFLKENYLKNQVTAKLLNHLISKGFQVMNTALLPH